MNRNATLLAFVIFTFVIIEEHGGGENYQLHSRTVQNSALIISEVADPADNYKARFVELYNAGNENIDLSEGEWYLCRQANGSPASWGDIALTGVIAPRAIYTVAYNSSEFSTSYGFEPDQSSGYIQGNGDDGYFLFRGGNHGTGVLIDAYGIIDQDGTGEPWEYLDSRSIRNYDVAEPRAEWNAGEWKTYFSSTEISQYIHHMSPSEHPETETSLAVTGPGNYIFDLEPTAVEMNIVLLSGGGSISVKKLQGRIPPNTAGIPGTDNISRYRWIISSSGSISSIAADFKFNLCDIINHGISENADDISLYIRRTPASGEFVNSGLLGYDDNFTPGNAGDDFMTIQGITEFGEYVFGSPTESLPVNLLYLTSGYKNGEVILEWATSIEVNNFCFRIERSRDRIDWHQIAEVPGSGNSNIERKYYYVDDSVDEFGLYFYRLNQVDFNGVNRYSIVTSIYAEGSKNYCLLQNYPNPFNSKTKIKYSIPVSETGHTAGAGQVAPSLLTRLIVFDVLGDEIAVLVNEPKSPGSYEAEFNGSGLASGIYYYHITAGDRSITRKMILLK